MRLEVYYFSELQPLLCHQTGKNSPKLSFWSVRPYIHLFHIPQELENQRRHLTGECNLEWLCLGVLDRASVRCNQWKWPWCWSIWCFREPLHPTCSLINPKREGAPLPALNLSLSLSSSCHCQCQQERSTRATLARHSATIKDYKNIMFTFQY